jgi:hypothetical protein
MHTGISLFEKPIARIKMTCDLMGISDDFERKLPALETHLEGLVADGETNEDRLTVSGLSFLKGTAGPMGNIGRGPRRREGHPA